MSALGQEDSLRRHDGTATLNLSYLDAQIARLAEEKDREGKGDAWEGPETEGTTDTTSAVLPEIQDAYDFCATELAMPQELIQGVLHCGSKLSVGGSSKSFKTWGLMNMGLSVGYGLPWLGCETVSARVLIVNLEIQAAFARRRLQALADAMAIQQEPSRVDVWNLRGFAACHAEIFPKIIAQIENGGYGLIILDPIYKLYGAGDNENGGARLPR